MKSNTSYQYVVIVCAALLVWGVASQSKSVAATDRSVDNQMAMRLAYETIETVKASSILVGEIEQLKARKENYNNSILDKKKIREDLEEKKKEYATINGLEKVTGRGVEIVASGGMVTEEMTDLINGIRNTKPKAIGINGRRVIYKSYFVIDGNTLEFDNQKISFPFTIQVIGDQDSLTKSLERSGGILDVIEKNSFGKAQFEVKASDELTLEPYAKTIPFRFAKPI